MNNPITARDLARRPWSTPGELFWGGFIAGLFCAPLIYALINS